MPLVSAACGRDLMWAEELHRNQRRKGKVERSCMEDQAIAGLLHDAIVAEGFREAVDAGQSHASIAGRFGEPVADIVRDCTAAAQDPLSPGPQN